MDVEEIASNDDSVKVKDDKEAIAKDTPHTMAGSTSGSLDSGNNHSSNSDLTFHEDQNDGDDGMDYCDDVSNYDDDEDYDYMCYDNDDDDECDYLNMQAQFDNVDLPAGVEATVSWLPASSSKASSQVSSLSHLAGAQTSNLTLPVAQVPASSSSLVSGGSNSQVASSSKTSSQVSSLSHLAGAQTSNLTLPVAHVPASSSSLVSGGSNSQVAQVPASNSSLVSGGSNSHGKDEATEDELMEKYQNFKHFDVVEDFSDHHYSNLGFQGQQPPKAWSKKVQDEWKILENDLPDTIYVRVYEARMDLLRAVIIGPQGTPYHDGLFVFDVLFPQNYPDVPPMVYYYSGGLRLNPNLYDCGKVCLSLLNTWTGKGNERWLPKTSTMLQVLVSIQALILNAKPFFNEPGYETSYAGLEGESRSYAYNEDAFVLSLKTMTYTLRRPPKHFEDLVIGHFRCHAVDVLSACKAYIEGAPVGSVVKGIVQGSSATANRSSSTFRESVSKMMNGLISLFTKNGAKDCDRFRLT